MPSWFKYLAKDIFIQVTGNNHFGNGYGNHVINTNDIEIFVNADGLYNVLILANRNDEYSTSCAQEVEYQQLIPASQP